jgi:hypothetical protein
MPNGTPEQVGRRLQELARVPDVSHARALTRCARITLLGEITEHVVGEARIDANRSKQLVDACAVATLAARR